MSTPEKPLPNEYGKIFFDLADPFLLDVKDKRIFAQETYELMLGTNTALYNLKSMETDREAVRQPTLTNQERADYLFMQLSMGVSSYATLRSTAYLVRNYLPLRTWPFEDVGYFFQLALLHHQERTAEMPAKQKQVSNTLAELRKRVHLPH